MFHTAIGGAFALTTIHQTLYIDTFLRFYTTVIPGTILKFFIYYFKWSPIRVNVLLSIACIVHFGSVLYILTYPDKSKLSLIFVNLIYSVTHTLYFIYVLNRHCENGRYIFSFIYNLRIVIGTLSDYWTKFELFCWTIIIVLYMIQILKKDYRQSVNKIIIIYSIPVVIDIQSKEISQRPTIIDYTSVINEVVNLIISYSFGFVIFKSYPLTRDIYYISCILSMIFMITINVNFSIRLNIFLLMFRLCFLIAMLMDSYSVPMNLFFGILGLLYYVHESIYTNKNFLILKSISADVISFIIITSLYRIITIE